MRAVLPWMVVTGMFLQPVRADTLIAGSVYYDSIQTLVQVVRLTEAHNEAGITELTQNEHISDKTVVNLDIEVLTQNIDLSQSPELPVEFRFFGSPTTYWTFSRNVFGAAVKSTAMLASPTPTAAGVEHKTVIPGPAATPWPTPRPTAAPTKVEDVATASPTPSAAPKPHPSVKATAQGQIIWHQVDGQWKWRPVDPHQFKGWAPGAQAP
jgi:hypothetical protein